MEGCSSAVDREGYVEEGSEDGHIFLWGPRWGGWKGVRVPGTYLFKKDLETEHITLRELFEGNLEGFFTGDPEGCVENGSGDGHPFLQEPRRGNVKGAHSSETLKDG
jgi:hypothetical protein